MEKRIALVTGATSGIGFETAKQLLDQGLFVILGARNEEKGQRKLDLLKKVFDHVDMVNIDTTSEKSVNEAEQTITEKYGRLDVLVNNAGIASDQSPVTDIDLEGWRATFETNLFGTMRVTNCFLPLLKKANGYANIVNVSSGLGSLVNMTDENHPYSQFKMTAYASSKAALNVYTIHLAKELKEQNVKVNAVCPGYTQSGSNTSEDAQPVEMGAKTPVYYAMLNEQGPTGGFFNQEGVQSW